MPHIHPSSPMLRRAILGMCLCASALSAAHAQQTNADTSAAVKSAPWAKGVTITLDKSAKTFNFKSDGIPDHGFAEKYLIPKDVRSQPFSDNAADEFDVVDSATYFSKTQIDTNIATSPVYSARKTDTSLGMIGVALSGAQLFNDYEDPQMSIVAMEDNAVHDHVAFLDDCNGHTLVDGTNYHYHGIPVCLTSRLDTAGQHSSMLGVLADGFPVYANLDEAGAKIGDSGLDDCSGHVGATPEFPDGIYHYHLTSDKAPYMVDCYHGEVSASASARGGPPEGGPPGGPDLAKAAAALGISEDALRDALGNAPPPDFDAAAAKLGISVEKLMAVLPPPPR